MKRFLLEILAFTVIVIGTIVYTFSLADGHADAFYVKISSNKKANLILGTSKAAQGIQPEILEKELHKEFFNYSFTIELSPYGEVYYRRIIEKLDTIHKNQIFILTVDAWSISTRSTEQKIPMNFREHGTFFNNLSNFSKTPNFEYLFKYYDYKYYNLLISNSLAFSHDDGWYEIKPKKNIDYKRRTEFTMKGYERSASDYQYSRIRNEYLYKTVEYLKKFGTVYLVRLPEDSSLYTIEQKIIPVLEEQIALTIKLSDGYLDLSNYNNQMIYTDGVHLRKDSGEQISTIIAKWIVDQKEKN
jgi:hypothetical protein